MYFSEQQFVNAGEEDEMSAVAGLRPQQTIAKFGEFIRNFQEDRTTNLYQYAYVWMDVVEFLPDAHFWKILPKN